ncbi:MAG: ATP-binding protein [Dehalococcoidales bacterium]|nr:ATP-binding protein [Dehalococcoidales bacterium]
MNDLRQRSAVPHQLIVTERDSDRDRLDQTLNIQVILSLVLGVLGIIAAVIVARLSRRIVRLLEEVRSQRDRVAELAEREKCQADEVDAIIENMAEGVVVMDRSGQVVRFNRVARQIWELPWPEGQYGHIGDFAPLDFRYPTGQPIPLEEWPIYRALRGETFRDFEAIYVRSDGKRYHLRFGGSAVRDGRGNMILAINVFYDISQIREMERQREEFISVVAHDLKGAMTIIRGYSELLLRSKDTLALPSSFQKAMDTVASQTRRLDRMIDDLLDVSRIEARRLKLEKRRVDLVSLIRDVVGRTEELTKGHQVSVEVRGTIPTVDVDPDRIEQIMTNLLSNAAKYSYPDTPITIDIEPRAEEVMVSVRNEGPGIEPADIPKLFARFYRTAVARLEGAPGLGLGLYITKGLVEAHGGRIWVESEPGRHATFHFTLPAV